MLTRTVISTVLTMEWENLHRDEITGLTGGAACFTYLLARGLVEELIDANREPPPADEGQPMSRWFIGDPIS